MVKHTQTIRRFWATNYLSVFDHFVKLALKELSNVEFLFEIFRTPILWKDRRIV